MKDKILIIGASCFGTSIANERSLRGDDVIIVDKNSSAFDLLSSNFSGYAIEGDATDLQVLQNAGINNAKEVVIATDDDNVNVYLAHLCDKLFNTPSIIIRLSDYDKKTLIEEKPNLKPIYPFALSMGKYEEMKGE